MAEDTSLISEYIDRSSIKADTDFMLQQLNAVLSGIRQVNSNKVSLDSANTFRTAAEGANALRQSTVQLVDAQGKLISTSNVIAGGLDKTTAGATKQRDALSALNAEYKVALRNSANMAIQFGEQSKEALDAADAAQKLKEKLDAATNIAKGKTTVNQTTNNTANTTATASSGDVSLTTNLDAIAQEQKRTAEATGAIVNVLDKQQVDGILSANEWGEAQLKAGGAAIDTADKVKVLAGVFETAVTPLQEYTDTLANNIAQAQTYKDRLANISKEIAGLDKKSPDFQASFDQLSQKQVQLKAQASDLNQTINAQVKYLSAAAGSTDQLSAKLGIMRDVERSLTPATKQSDFGQQLIKDIQTLDLVVKQNEATVGNFQRNVGNYANSLAPLFDKVAAEITKLKTEQQGLLDLSQRNPIGFQISGGNERLNQVTGFIDKLQQVQQIGFKSSGPSQISTLDKALQDASKDGAQTSEIFKELIADLNVVKSSASVTGTTFSNAFKVLETELGNVRTKLSDPTLSGTQLKQLEQEERLLSQLTENLSQVFTSSRQQLLAYREAAVQLGTSLGESDSAVVAFAEAVGKADNQVIQIRKNIQLQSQNLPALVGALNAVQGLVGVFAAAQGAAQLFDADNQDLQKTMVKFQALLSIINGLQSVNNALQKDAGVINLVLSARMKLVNAAQSIQEKLFAQTAVAVQADAIALGETATAAEVNAVAQGKTTVATETATGAMAAEGVAATVTATGIKGLTAALAFGLGAAFVAVAAVIVYAASKLNDWIGRHIDAVKRAGELADAIRDENNVLIEQAALFTKSQEGLKQYFEKQLEFTQAAGISIEKQFALRKQIAIQEKVLAETQLQTLNVTQEQQTVLLSQIESLQAQKENFTQQLQAAIAHRDEPGIEAIGKNIDKVDKQLGALTPLYNAAVAGRERLNAANKELAKTDIEQQTFSDAEQRKLILAQTEVQVDLIKSRNDRILSSDRSSLAERLKALSSNAIEERKLIETQRQDVIKNPGSTTDDIKIANAKALADNKKVTEQLVKERFDTIFSERVREVTAEKDIDQQRVQIELETNQKIASNQVFTLNQRLQAQATYNADQKKLLDDNLRLQLTNAGFSDKEIAEFEKTGKAEIAGKRVTAAELLDIQTQYETSVLKLAIDNGEQVNNIIKSDLQKQNTLFQEHLSDIKEAFGSVDIDFSIGNSKEIIALNESLKKREISTKEYGERRKNLEFKFQQEITQNLISSLEAQLNLYSDTDQKKLDAQIKVDNLRTQIARSTTDVEREELRKRLEIAEIELSFAKKDSEEYQKLVDNINKAKATLATGATTKETDDKDKRLNDLAKELGYVEKFGEKIASINDAIADRRIAAIQREQDALDAQHNRENDIINQSVLKQDEKNKKLAESDARYAASKNQLDQKAREAQRKKAVADKAAALFQIALNTAVAVVQALATPGVGIGEAIAIGALGAIELAAAAAAPLPQFKEGKNVQDAPTNKDRYEGHAVVGDGGKSELIIREDGRMEVTPAQSTITYLKSRDIVLPDAKKALAQMHDVTSNMDNRVSNISHNTTIRSYQTAQRYEATKSGDVHFEKFNDTLSKGLKSLEQTIKNKKENHIHFADRGKALVHSGKNIWEQLNR